MIAVEIKAAFDSMVTKSSIKVEVEGNLRENSSLNGINLYKIRYLWLLKVDNFTARLILWKVYSIVTQARSWSGAVT